MVMRPAAEYEVPGEVVFVVGRAFVVRVKSGDLLYLSLYRFPAHFQRSMPLLGAPSISEISAAYTEDTGLIDVSVQSTQQRLSFYTEDGKHANDTYTSSGAVTVKNGPTVYIHGRKAFTIPCALPSAYYYDPDSLTLYTCSLDRAHIHEYSLFVAGQILPYGAYYVHEKYIEIYTAGKKYAIPMQYVPGMLISIYMHENCISTAFSFGDTLMSNNCFKTYPAHFCLDKIWCRRHYVYLYSSTQQKLYVLSKKLDIKYEICAEAVYISTDYVFMQKDKKVVVHSADTFRYAFYLTDLSISDETVCIGKNGQHLYAVEQKGVSRKDVPLFYIRILFFDLLLSAMTVCIPTLSSTAPVYGTGKYVLGKKSGETMYLTSRIHSTSSMLVQNELVLLCLAGSAVLFVFRGTLLDIPLSAIQDPFFWSTASTCNGASIFVSAQEGSIGIAGGKGMCIEYLFSPLILLMLHGYVPASILFIAYARMPEFAEGIRKTLFHLLDTDEIEMAIDLLDHTKKQCFAVYEAVVSGMIRLLDEKNMAKLYAMIDYRDLGKFGSADALGRMLLQDFSLLARFLDACIREDREYLVTDVIDFFSGLDLLDLHESMLHMLVCRNMLYAAGLLLSSRVSKCKVVETDTPQELSAIRAIVADTDADADADADTEADARISKQNSTAQSNVVAITQQEMDARNRLIHTFAETTKSIACIQNSSEPVAEMWRILRISTDPIFTGMLAERLLALRWHTPE